jgi:hypothetical protein
MPGKEVPGKSTPYEPSAATKSSKPGDEVVDLPLQVQ